MTKEEEIKKLAEYTLSTSDIIRLPGEGKKGEVFEEFYLNEKELEKMLIEMFYILQK